MFRRIPESLAIQEQGGEAWPLASASEQKVDPAKFDASATARSGLAKAYGQFVLETSPFSGLSHSSRIQW